MNVSSTSMPILRMHLHEQPHGSRVDRRDHDSREHRSPDTPQNREHEALRRAWLARQLEAAKGEAAPDRIPDRTSTTDQMPGDVRPTRDRSDHTESPTTEATRVTATPITTHQREMAAGLQNLLAFLDSAPRADD